MADANDFLGSGWGFPPTFRKENEDEDCYPVLAAGREDINQSLYILLSTSLGERVMQPQYGCNLSDYQFESMSNTLVGFIIDLVENAILYYEARILVDSITVTEPDSWDAIQGYLRINIDYTVRTTNSRYNYVYDFYIREGNTDGVNAMTATK
ncbi:GPW/gp25 family protein [Chitinophaga nivalis]|uniref:GPW/gp25 family protein n=1 Tax=Chitinophaga nivalis TaxID=2991709 RepID=A0ABT3IP69_9BACT|nr:GPW/gp25 family protein [Chitinophaga nivalis]MCW3464571.1 GPW/gp25 family protein [Chitinophaga nivalis]MCW3485738.1 GPW/gp25 family protein [Chitinophaga nivalis]